MSFGVLKGSSISDARDWPTGRTIRLEPAEQYPLSARIGVAWAALVSFVVMLATGVVVLSRIDRDLANGIARWTNRFSFILFAPIVTYPLLKRLKRVSVGVAVICPMLGLNQVRTQLMTTTLSTRLTQTPVDSALVIVGRAHLNGMVALLKELGWFEPIVRELDPPQTSLGEFR